MKKRFSWYTLIWKERCGKLYYFMASATGMPVSLKPYYKPNRKGGHTHNHIRNANDRNKIRSKSARQDVRKFLYLQ